MPGFTAYLSIPVKRHPFHQSPTRVPGRFELFLGSSAILPPSAQGFESTIDRLLAFSTVIFTILSHRDLFWLHKLAPQNGSLFIYLTRHGSRCTCNCVAFALAFLLSFPSKLRRLLPFQVDSSLKSSIYHYCNPSLSLHVLTGQISCPVRKH